jgi:hypothetical protein
MFIRETPLDGFGVTALLGKNRSPFTVRPKLNQANQNYFQSLVRKEQAAWKEPFSTFAGEYLIELQKLLTTEFSDRSLLQFFDNFFAFLAFELLLEPERATAVLNALEMATHYTLVNKAKSITDRSVDDKAVIEETITEFIYGQGQHLQDVLSPLNRNVNSLQRIVNSMFVGPDAKRLEVYEMHYDALQLDDIHKENATMAIDSIIAKGNRDSLARILRSPIYDTTLKIKSEFELMRRCVANQLPCQPVTLRRARISRLPFTTGDRHEDLRILTALLQTHLPNIVPNLEELIAEFQECVESLCEKVTFEAMQAGLLVIKFLPDLHIGNYRLLPRVPRQQDFRSFLIEVDRCPNFSLFAIARYRNGIRRQDDDAFNLGPPSFFMPSFLMPNYFRHCRTMNLAPAMVGKVPHSIANLIQEARVTAIGKGRREGELFDAK